MNVTILLVDDDVSLLVTLGDLLRFHGYRVKTAESGETALSMLREISPDLIILDMSMPGMGGAGFLKAIRAPDGTLRHPVLVLSARVTLQDVTAQAAVDGYVSKPCDPPTLLAEIGRILARRGTAGGEARSGGTPGSKRVLIGEDDGQALARITADLKEGGFTIESVRNGAELLEKALLERPDAILIKERLGSMRGGAVAGMLRSMPGTKDIPVVLYDGTNAGAPDASHEDVAPGIRKPVRSADGAALLDAVRAALGG